jgi:putative glutamine amidotransferase
MPAPLIGLTTRNTDDPNYKFPLISSPKSYTQALIRAGALPVLVPLNLHADQYPAILERLDGMIFTGGGDLHPERYGGQPHPKVGNVDQERDQAELGLFAAVRQAGLPFLGICRGLQVINVALGGTLYEHISDQHPGALEHDCYPAHPTDHLAHPVKIEADSQLAAIVGGTQLQVNSLHHQGMKDLAPGLAPLAWAPDGLLEAYHLPEHPQFGLAIQWHPEWLPEQPQHRAIFSSFIQAAQTRK